MHRPCRPPECRRWLPACLLPVILGLGTVASRGSEPVAPPVAKPRPVSYTRDIRPLLATSCFTCHGPDANKREADLRLDDRQSAVTKAGAIVPGKADESPLIDRISSHDDSAVMPPPQSKKPRLGPAEIALVRRWIDEGAKYEPHWAFRRIQRPAVPEVRDPRFAGNPVDRFLAAALAEEQLAPAAPADRRTLLRRLAFDLTGLPPQPAEVDAFAADRASDAWSKRIEQFLARPQYGERMAAYWLDVVRYADTQGYHSDNERSVYLYRDYVIRAFNENKPFNQFTREQIAGDLLPGATLAQKIASGYNRLLQTTEEGGAQPKEYQAKYDADRVRNTSTAWLGATMMCCQCHNHKYDPYTMQDYYSMAAVFADVKEKAVGRQEQTPVPSPEQAAALAKLDAQIAPLKQHIDRPTPALIAAQAEWEKQLLVKCACGKPDPAAIKKFPKDIQKILNAAAEKRSPQQKQALAAFYREKIDPSLADLRAELAPLQKQRDALVAEIPTTLWTESTTPRVVRILPRGNWQDDSGAICEPAIPAVFGKLNVGDRRVNRLDFANWLVGRDNPLVARVFVNRLWKLYFGQGLSRTVEDCGTQGALPTHPELLDWLAAEFIESGWDVKHLVRLMVGSQAYQMSSEPSPDAKTRDPANQWLSHQNRVRYEAETVRDNALAVSGLLAPTIGGPSVKPYQPAGYWDFLNFPKRQWADDHGANAYRRGLYTFWQRTLLHPSLQAFDACTREESTPDRAHSNTPLQALVLLNDPTYVEAARVFAARIVREGGAGPTDRLQFAFREALERTPRPQETALLTALLDKHRRQYAADPAAAKALLGVGDAQPPAGVDPAELAAWTSAARVILNLHESITRY